MGRYRCPFVSAEAFHAEESRRARDHAKALDIVIFQDSGVPRARRDGNTRQKAVFFDLANHFPINNARYCSDFVSWFGERPNAQRVLDTALAWAVLNDHFEVADFLLAHGADIDTNWCSHEPASILHELVWHKNYQAMRFLIDRGIDMTIRDYRWGATAEGWARVAAKDDQLGDFLQNARQRRDETSL
jgi:hypothetical protein